MKNSAAKIKKNDLTFLNQKMDEKKARAKCVLIIDDDVDAIIPVASLFQKLGCNTICITDFNEAIKSICNYEADIIILDWMLDEKNGGEVILNSIKKMKKFKKQEEKKLKSNLILITYSGRKKEEIQIPKTNLFTYLEHWEKPLDYNEILLNMHRILS